MKFALIASSIAICAFTSCGQADVDVKTDSPTPTAGTEAAAPSVSSAPAMSAPVNIPLNLRGLTAVGQPGGAGLNPEHGKPGHRCDIAVGAPLNSAPSSAGTAQPIATSLPSSSGTTAVGINPEHGKPGHRCDIAVGAPLNSAPAAANTATSVSAPAQVPTPVIQPASTGLNPEHGKPGHRCDIAVGAPLNSKPNTSAAKPTATTSSPAITKVAPGMNPQHGQPGHRCDIAVGAPLNSKPAPAATTPTPAAPAETETKKDSTGGL